MSASNLTFLPKPPILDLLKHYISLVCSVPVDIIELEMKSLFWFQLILWFGRSASKDKGICGLYAEVIGLIPNWVSGEKGAGWHARHLHLFVSGGGKGDIFFSVFLFDVNCEISLTLQHQSWNLKKVSITPQFARLVLIWCQFISIPANFHPWFNIMSELSLSYSKVESWSYTEKKNLFRGVFLLSGHRPVMESADRFVSPKDPWSWVGLVTKPWFC